MTIDEAYAACWAITSSEAKNFAYGIRLLPPAKRNAMAALYALARRIDDIGDGDDPPEVKVAKLDEVRGRPGDAAVRRPGGVPATRSSPPSPTPRRASRSRSRPSTS